MVKNENIKLLRVWVGESDKVYQRLLYEAIVYGARKYGIAGATVTRGIMSYGASSKMHTCKVFALAEDLPVVIEIVDNEQKLKGFIDIIKKLFDKSKSGGLITIQAIELIRYAPSQK